MPILSSWRLTLQILPFLMALRRSTCLFIHPLSTRLGFRQPLRPSSYIRSNIYTQSRTLSRRPFTVLAGGTTVEPADNIIFGDQVPFAELGLRTDVLKALENVGKVTSTQIQALTIPAVLEGEDLIIGSETGSGKTLAYMIPLIQKTLYDIEELGVEGFSWEYPRALVLVPNRQLCDQVLRMSNEVLEALGENPVKLEAFYGSTFDWPFKPSFPAPHIMICTPAFISAFHRDIYIFENIDVLVIDEADLLMEGDFGRHLDNLLVAFKRADRARAARNEPPSQYVLSAATIPSYGLKSVEKLVKQRFPQARRVSADFMHRHHPMLTQTFEQVPNDLEAKVQKLIGILKAEDPLSKTMVFANTVGAVKVVCEGLDAAGVSAIPYHKDLSMEERTENLDYFRGNSSAILVCTDLAARGIDIPDVKHVIQVEFAPNVVQHLHRIGRAVRAGRAGRSTNWYDEAGKDLVDSIKKAGSKPLERSFSRQRGFRKKIKKYGRDFFLNDNPPAPSERPPKGSKPS